MSQNKKKYIGKLFTNKDLKVLIIPLIIEQFLAITVGMSDTMMVSFAGEAAVSGVSLVDMVNNVIIAVLASKNRNATVYLKLREVFKLKMDLMKRILYIGIPSGVENSLFQVGRVAVVSIISNFGRVEIAANAIANNLDGLGVNMGNAVGIARSSGSAHHCL